MECYIQNKEVGTFTLGIGLYKYEKGPDFFIASPGNWYRYYWKPKLKDNKIIVEKLSSRKPQFEDMTYAPALDEELLLKVFQEWLANNQDFLRGELVDFYDWKSEQLAEKADNLQTKFLDTQQKADEADSFSREIEMTCPLNQSLIRKNHRIR